MVELQQQRWQCQQRSFFVGRAAMGLRGHHMNIGQERQGGDGVGRFGPGAAFGVGGVEV